MESLGPQTGGGTRAGGGRTGVRSPQELEERQEQSPQAQQCLHLGLVASSVGRTNSVAMKPWLAVMVTVAPGCCPVARRPDRCSYVVFSPKGGSSANPFVIVSLHLRAFSP